MGLDKRESPSVRSKARRRRSEAQTSRQHGDVVPSSSETKNSQEKSLAADWSPTFVWGNTKWKGGCGRSRERKKKPPGGKTEWKWVRQGNRIQFRLTHQLFITVCIPISYISKGRQRLCPQGPVICTRGRLAAAWFPWWGTTSLRWRWRQADLVHWPRGVVTGTALAARCGDGNCVGREVRWWEQELRALGWWWAAVTFNLSLWANELTGRNVGCCEGGKREVTTLIRFEHSGKGTVQGVHLYSAKHVGMCLAAGVEQVLQPWLRISYKPFLFF